MDFLLPGYPQDNPILKGVASIVAGEDPELALAARDRALSTPYQFAEAALSAACWIPAGHPLLEDLADQATEAFTRSSSDERAVLCLRATDLSFHGHEQVLALTAQWASLESAR